MNVRLCAIVKKEVSYFAHWKNWHEDRGFIVTIYVDDSSEFNLYDCEDKRTSVSFQDAQSWKRQIDSMNDYLKSLEQEQGWALLIDIDEYCHFTADEFLETASIYPDKNVIQLFQVPYIAHNEEYLEKFVNLPVTDRFLKQSCARKYQTVKLAVRLGSNTGLSTMNVASEGISTEDHDCRQNIVKNIGFTLKHHLRHYITKSREEWTARRSNDLAVSATGRKYGPQDFDMYNELF